MAWSRPGCVQQHMHEWWCSERTLWSAPHRRRSTCRRRRLLPPPPAAKLLALPLSLFPARRPKELRQLKAELGVLASADGSAMFEMGNTKVRRASRQLVE